MSKRLFLILALLAICRDSARALEFSLENPGLPAVKVRGRIVEGDAARLKEMLTQIPRDRFGLKHLHLDSVGGSVEEAFRMADVMDAVGVSTLVPPNASCASACASILFIAGRLHIVAPRGQVGFHTCYKTTTLVGDEVCNERIANFALDRGTAYGSIFPSMQAAGPDDMIWFSAELADCYGLNAWPEGMQPATWNSCVHQAIRDSACRAGELKHCR